MGVAGLVASLYTLLLCALVAQAPPALSPCDCLVVGGAALCVLALVLGVAVPGIADASPLDAGTRAGLLAVALAALAGDPLYRLLRVRPTRRTAVTALKSRSRSRSQ